jgi:hypothetical protein
LIICRLQVIADLLKLLTNAVGDGSWPLCRWAVNSAAPASENPRDFAVCLPTVANWLFGQRHVECDQIDPTA